MWVFNVNNKSNGTVGMLNQLTLCIHIVLQVTASSSDHSLFLYHKIDIVLNLLVYVDGLVNAVNNSIAIAYLRPI